MTFECLLLLTCFVPSQELTSIGSATYNDKGILDPKMIKDLSLGFIYLVLGCGIKTNLKRKTTICSFLYLSTIQMPLCRGGGWEV